MRILAGPTRLELATSCVTGRRSNQTELRPQKLIRTKILEDNIKYFRYSLQENFYSKEFN
jgi:hypothetical protein